MYITDEFVEQILNANDSDQNNEEYVTARINGNNRLLAKLTKVGNKMYMAGKRQPASSFETKRWTRKREHEYVWEINAHTRI